MFCVNEIFIQIFEFPLQMVKRDRNIILFFEENENVKSISSKMVRLYMNRFIIDEEERFEITGVFNLAKVPKIPDFDKRRKLWNISMRNWIEDRHTIKTAFDQLDISSWFKTDIHIFMGTSLYLEDSQFNKSLYNFLQNWADKCCSTTSISLTLLNGNNHGLHTKKEVKDAYRTASIGPRIGPHIGRRVRELGWFQNDSLSSQSLNHDLENLFEDMTSASAQISNLIRRQSVVRELFLYEMQNEDKIETRTDDHQFLLSLCKRFSVYLK